MNLSLASLGILGKYFSSLFSKPRKAEIELHQTKLQGRKPLTIPWMTQVNENCQNWCKGVKNWARIFSVPALDCVGSAMPALATPTHRSGDGAHVEKIDHRASVSNLETAQVPGLLCESFRKEMCFPPWKLAL